jgi:hypothetical protein
MENPIITEDIRGFYHEIFRLQSKPKLFTDI